MDSVLFDLRASVQGFIVIALGVLLLRLVCAGSASKDADNSGCSTQGSRTE